MLELRLLGEPEVLRDGHAVPLPASKKSRALLAYLAVTGRPHLRERLCELLWEGPDDPRAALRWSLTKLRPLIEPHLVAGRDHVEFRADGAAVDIHRLCAPANATTEHLEECAALFRGELAEGLDLPGCFRFQQWCAAERERFRQNHVAILAELTERLGADDRALVYARRRVQVDPFDEQSHAALIRLLATLGDRQQAMHQYEHCRMLFERELGGRPGEIVEDARRMIGKTTPLSPPRGERVAEGRVRGDFVGRANELSIIESTTDPILILGEPGIGKSRLLEEARRRTPGLYGRAFASEMARPYGVWLDALEDFPVESDRPRLFDAIVDKLNGVELLELDDIQWIDEASAALLHYVARKTSLRIVCAARLGEIDDNPHASRLVHELRFTHVDLGPMSSEEIGALVADSPERKRVIEDSGGNPLFALELARSQQAGTLTQVIAGRLGQLEGRARDLVSWAAAIGRRFDGDILGRATEMPSGEMLAALEKLERSAIIRASESGGCYDFTHDLVRDAAYQAISGPRRVLVHRNIARALLSVHDPDSALAGDVVRHASLAGDHDTAVKAAIAAGRRCLRMFAWADAIEIARLALQFAESLPQIERVKRQMHLLEIIVVSRGPISERLPFATRVTELIDEAYKLGLSQIAAIGSHLSACLYADSDNLGDAAQQSIRSSELMRSGDPRAAAYTMANTARCLLFIERDIPRAQSLLGEVESIIREVGGEHVEIHLGLGYLHAHRGDKELAISELQRAFDMASRARDHWREWCAGARLLTLALEWRDFDAARRWCERLEPVAEKMPGGSEGVKTEMLAAVLRYATLGDEANLRAKLEELRIVDSKSDLAWSLAYVAELELERGEMEKARRDAQEALAAAETVGRPSDAAIARLILGLPIDEAKRDDLSDRARKKERNHAEHGRGANV
ncbi:MAG TPA: BTAD domain-containing putative transcriptional regulator [Thermoanaerobaculia bacterium]|nr:BTAD domain-containing putative transcriptional regulator [Thermoanaerobaculia bacterium]